MRVVGKPGGAWRRLVGVLVVSVVVMVGGAVAWLQQASGAVKTLATFSQLGQYKWKVPTGVTSVTFDVYGASGGNVLAVQNGVVTVVTQGGAGGEAKGRFSVHPGEVFEIVVGGHGTSETEGVTNQFGYGGFNGGGTGDQATQDGGTLVSGGGGGASDVRIGGRGNTCASTVCGLQDRIIVAGGGGGGSDGNTSGGNGGAGGGVTGGGPSRVGGGQENFGLGGGGISGDLIAGFGQGASATEGTGIGGGGGGWYGGGSSNGSNGINPPPPGSGGGSGYISQLTLSGSFHTATHLGDGEVIITTP